MKKILCWIVCCLLAISALSFAAAADTALPAFEGKPRLLITQDGEVDDMNSLIHTLLYANELDIEGIVQTSSKLHFSGDGAGIEPYRWMGTDWMPTSATTSFRKVTAPPGSSPCPMACAAWKTSHGAAGPGAMR